MYAEALDIETSSFSDEQHFIDDLDGDSLQVLSAALKTEEQFSITIPVEEYGQCTTVIDMSALIYAKLNGQTAYESQGQPDETIQPIERFEDAPEFIAFQKRIDSLAEFGGVNPYFVCHESPLSDTSLMDGHEVLNFGSYNYAGMSGRPEVIQAAKDAMDKYGTSASGSRLLAGEKELFLELEKELADWKHTEDALVLVGGHSTNVTFVGNFCDQNDLILYDVLAHNSIEQGCRLEPCHLQALPPQRRRVAGPNPARAARPLCQGADHHRGRVQHGRRYRRRARLCGSQEKVRVFPAGGRSTLHLRDRENRRRRGRVLRPRTRRRGYQDGDALQGTWHLRRVSGRVPKR